MDTAFVRRPISAKGKDYQYILYEGKQFIFAYERTYMLLIPSTERVRVREGRFDPLGSEEASAASAGPASAHPVLAFPRKLFDIQFK